MTQLMMQSLSPLLILAFGTVLSLLLIAWRRSQKLILTFTLAIFVCTLLACISLMMNLTDAVQVTTLMKVDNYGNFAFALILVASIAVGLLSSTWLTHSVEVHDEYYILLQLVALGAGVLVMSDHFASLFLGFELLSIALVGMVGYSRDSQYSVESSFKYLILSATASSFMLLGIAFIYSYSGSLSFSIELLNANDANTAINLFYHAGILLFLVGIAFKLSFAPFHLWTPDVYQGAPTPVTLLLATVSKVAMFVVLMKFWFSQPLLFIDNGNGLSTLSLISIFAVLSMLIGNALALKQLSIKRLLAYSSIAHMGYLLIVLMVVSPQSISLAWQSALFYLSAYVLATVSLFMVMQLTQDNQDDIELNVEGWRGLFWRNKSLAMLVIIGVLSMAGIPLTMGFIGKFYLLNVAFYAQQWWLITALIIGSGIGLVYYLGIIFMLFSTSHTSQNNESHKLFKVKPLANIAVIMFALFGVLLGVYPDLLSQVLTKF
jgi:NADH-quinone oxidoreductase subunit N